MGSEDEIITLEEYRELEPWLIPEEEIPKLPDMDVMCLSKENQDNQVGRIQRFPWSGALLVPKK